MDCAHAEGAAVSSSATTPTVRRKLSNLDRCIVTLALSQDFAGMPEVCRIGADLIWRRKLLQRLHNHLLQGLAGRRSRQPFCAGVHGFVLASPPLRALAQADPHVRWHKPIRGGY